MTIPGFTLPPRWRGMVMICALSAVCCALSPAAIAGEVLVVTDTRHPVTAYAEARIVELDRPSRIEAALTAELPVDPARAAALVQQRLRDGGQDWQRQLGRAYQDVIEAWQLGVAKLPAVVVDQRYVVYGEVDVARAVARITTYLREDRP